MSTVYPPQSSSDEEQWYWSDRNKRGCSGPIGDLFMACMRDEIGPDDFVHCNQFGSKRLKEFPFIVNAFKKHVAECYHKLRMSPALCVHQRIYVFMLYLAQRDLCSLRSTR